MCFHGRCLVILRLGVSTLHLVVLSVSRGAHIHWAPGEYLRVRNRVHSSSSSSTLWVKGGLERSRCTRVHANNTHDIKHPTTSTPLNHQWQQDTPHQVCPEMCQICPEMCRFTIVFVFHTVQVNIHTR